jgi:type IV secretory pathway VirB4 component
MFDYFEDVAPDMEFDAVAICCEYTEHSAREAAACYGLDIEGMDDEDDVREFVLAYLSNNTCVIGVTGSGDIVYAQF